MPKAIRASRSEIRSTWTELRIAHVSAEVISAVRMSVDQARVFCQNCRSVNSLRDEFCHACATRLLIFAPHRATGAALPEPTRYEEVLLQRIALLEDKLSEMAEVLELTMDALRDRSTELVENHAGRGMDRPPEPALGGPVKQTRSNGVNIANAVAGHSGPNSQILSELLGQAAMLIDQGEEKEALRMYERCLLLSSANEALYLDVGVVCFERERFSEALRIFEKLCAIAPSRAGAAFMTAVLSAQTGDLDTARQLFSRIDTTWEIGDCAKLFRALTEIADGELEKAERFLSDFADSFGVSAEVSIMLASLRFDRGSFDSARKAVEQAISLEPRCADTLFLAAMIYGKMGFSDRSREFVATAASCQIGGALCGRYLVVGGDFPARSLAFEHLTTRRSGIISGLPRQLRMFSESILLRAVRA